MSNSSLRKSPPVPVRVCSRSPVKICKQKAREKCGKDSKAGLSALLCFVIDGEKAKNEEGGEERMGGCGVTKDRTLSNQKAAEKRIGLKE